MTSFQYNKVVDSARLKKEIEESTITKALDYISTDPATVTVVFKADLDTGEETTLATIVTSHVNTPLPENEIKTVKIDAPTDSTNRQVVRLAATVEGFHYQLLSCEITTAKKDGFYCKDEDGNNLGFVTHKIYDANGAEITDSANEANAVETRVWIRPTHSFEIIGAIFAQKESPTTDVRMWVTGLPGIYNIRFARGGINLKHIGASIYQLADGRASKYLAYNAQVPDANSFKFTVKHNTGLQHNFQVSLEIYRAP